MFKKLIALFVTVLATISFGLFAADKAAEPVTVTGKVTVVKAEKATTITLTVAAAKEGEQATVYTLVAEGDAEKALATADGKTVAATGVVTKDEKGALTLTVKESKVVESEVKK
jgi:hypothetical protein